MGGLFGGGSTTVTEEQRIGSFQINQATYGATVGLVLGTTRVSGNIIDWFDFVAIPHESRQQAGKGGGGSTTVSISYTYQVAVLIGLGEGPVNGVWRVWRDKEMLGNLAAAGLTLYAGQHGQEPWPYAKSKHPERALPYSGLAYVAGVVDLKNSGGLPQLNFEVNSLFGLPGDGLDVNAADACAFIISDPVNGAGFGPGVIDQKSLARYRTFCNAADLLITAPLTSQQDTYQIIQAICDATNTIQFFSQGRLKFVPRCDSRLEHNGHVFEPDSVPLYDLGPDDFLDQDNGCLVSFNRADSVDAYNHTSVEFVNRANQYKEELAEYKVQADINRRGLRSASSKKLHYLHTKARAEYVASLLAMDSLYARTKYKFRLGWTHCLLEPGDFVTLTDEATGLNKKAVIIESVEENEFGDLDVVAKERPPGVYSPARYTTKQADRQNVDFNAAPGDVSAPAIFEPPEEVTNGPEVWIATCGQKETWGGCSVWISDEDKTYKKVGLMNGPARYGALCAALPAGDEWDAVNAITVKLYGMGLQLQSGTQADALNANTLLWVDGECIAYQTATLTGQGEYRLTGLKRGVYNTKICDHAAGVQVVRMDQTVFRYSIQKENIGREVFVKFCSFNSFGVAEQSLEDVKPILHKIQNVPPPDVTAFMVEKMATGKTKLSWDYPYSTKDVAGFRLRYNVGTSRFWSTAVPLHDGLIAGAPYEAAIPKGKYTVMIKAVDSFGMESTTAAVVTLGLGDDLVDNVLVEADFKALGWRGAFHDCHVDDGMVVAVDPGAVMWNPSIGMEMWRSDDASFYGANFRAIEYQDSFYSDVGGYLTIEMEGDGNAQYFYRQQYPAPMWSNDKEPMFAVDSAAMWHPGQWLRYTGKALVSPDDYDVKVQIYGGLVEPRIKKLRAFVDVPDLMETINDFVVPVGGCRLPLKNQYHNVKNVSITLQDDGGHAVTAKVVDKSANGPRVVVCDQAGNSVKGVIDATIQGY